MDSVNDLFGVRIKILEFFHLYIEEKKTVHGL